MQVSRNGRWALTYSERYSGETKVSTTTLIDLESGSRSESPTVTVWDHFRLLSLTSDGGVLAVQPGEQPIYGILRDGRFTPLPFPAGRRIYPHAISDDGRTIVASEIEGQAYPFQSRLLTISTSTGAIASIAEARNPAGPLFLSVSNDGRRVLYQMAGAHEGGPAYIWDAETRHSTPVPLDPGESVQDGVLSGDGRIAFVATTRARIVRFTIDVKVAAPLFTGPPYCDSPGWLAMGSAARLRCTFSGSVLDLQGRILLGATAMPVLSSNSGAIEVQIPWEVEPRNRLSYDLPTDSPFRGSQSADVEQGAPEILPDSRGLFGMWSARRDWSGPLTSLPAAGDVFHVYMTGLGPVRVGQVSGAPPPLDAPVPIRWQLDCAVLPGRQPVETLFAGLAPGMIGVYQTTFRMPAVPPRGPQPDGFECMLASDTTAVSFRPGDTRQPICGGGCAIATGPR